MAFSENSEFFVFTKLGVFIYQTIYFANAIPATQHKTQTITLVDAYIAATPQSPFSINVIVSNEKVEKVVNPPQKPTLSSSDNLSSTPFISATPAINPMMNDPTMLAIIVLNGNAVDTGR